MKRKLLALTLALAMAFSVLTVAAFAEGDENYQDYPEMFLDTPVAVSWNEGKPSYFRFEPPETGYYTFTPASIDMDYYDMALYNLEDWTVGGASIRIAFTSFMLRGGQYVFCAGGDEAEDYTVTVTKAAGFQEFLRGSQEWTLKEEPEKTVTLPATTFEGTYQYSLQYYAVPIHVPETGRYSFTVENTHRLPVFLDEDGSFFAVGQGDRSITFALDLEGGKTYYMLPDTLGTTAETIKLTAEQVDPAEICLDSYTHDYLEQSVRKATLTEDGVRYLHCDKCDRTEPVTILSVEGFNLYDDDLNEPHYIYDGTPKEPYIFARNRNGVECYYNGFDQMGCPLDVTYSNNVNAGTATATIVMDSDYYEGQTTVDFRIAPRSLEDAEISTVEDQGYTGKPITPAVTVKVDGKKLTKGTDYTLSYQDNVETGTATITVKGKGNYTGSAPQTFSIVEACTDGKPHDWKETVKKATFKEDGGIFMSCSKCGRTMDGMVPLPAVKYVKLSATSYTYNGKAKKPKVSVGCNAGELLASDQYKVTYSKNTNAGTATATVTLTGKWYEGTKKLTFTIKKAANPMTVKGKTATVKYSAVKKKTQTIAAKKAFSLSKAQGKVTYKKSGGNKNITVSSAGKLTVKKKTKKGSYPIKVKVTAAGNGNYKAASKTVTVTVKVK